MFLKGDNIMFKYSLIFCVLVFLVCPVQAELIDNGDGTITDTTTGLILNVEISSIFIRSIADSWIGIYNLSPDYNNWRYPTWDEMITFIKRYNLPLDACLWYDHPTMAICTDGVDFYPSTVLEAYLLMVRTTDINEKLYTQKTLENQILKEACQVGRQR